MGAEWQDTDDARSTFPDFTCAWQVGVVSETVESSNGRTDRPFDGWLDGQTLSTVERVDRFDRPALARHSRYSIAAPPLVSTHNSYSYE